MDSTTTLPLYQYQPLHGPTFVRLLILQPSNDLDSTLLCEIVHVDRRRVLRDPHNSYQYDAVSYAWGENPIFDKALVCDKGTSHIPITNTVNTMLRNLRKADKPRVLWIDAICLNQADDHEKSQQVPLMRDIYKQARKVRLWLGEDDIKMREAIGILREFSARKQIGLSTVAISPADLQAVAQLLNRSWFSRRWVLQEAFVNSTVVVHYGRSKMPWGSLIGGMATARLDQSVTSRLDLRTISALETMEALHSSRGEYDMLLLLWKFHASKCKEHKDRIFALRGLWKSKYLVLPGYSLPWYEIYKVVAKFATGPVLETTTTPLVVFGRMAVQGLICQSPRYHH